ncbi:hypothetical protein DL766_009935 [Monosporascus sp. MC13-8B]|nr:hypothetical protein DL763_005399 [Monosporascus cannonballus]RYP12714.1 hypothetical protein DL766_009935 [Monosporascus sp. MC13-8B]
MAYAPVPDQGPGIHPGSSHFQPSDHAPWEQQEHYGASPNAQFLPTTGGQNPSSEAEVQEISPYWTYPGEQPYVPSHHRGWSGSTISTTKADDKRTPPFSATPSLRKKRPSPSSSRGGGGSWTLEIVTIAIALGAVGSILGVLARFNGQALPEWPYYITLNALIALLATVTTAAMGISLDNGLSQLKWIRFKESRAPLTDMEAFDDASRGIWGAARLLASARGGFLGSFGAVIAIVALGLSPFAQQVVTYQTRTVEGPEGASVNRALNYTGALPGNTSETGFVPILPLKSAVYNGLFAENGRPGAALAFECQSGNCTWDPYETLGVCSECHSLTEYMRQYCAPGTADDDDCGWQVPQGARLASRLEVFGMTSYIPAAGGDMPHATIMKLIFMGTEAQDGRAGELKPWARECSLSACLQTLETTVANGVLTEKVARAELNNTVVDIRDSGDGGKDNGVYFTGSLDNSTAYLLGIEAMLSMRGWFATLFANGSAVRSAADFNRTVTDSTVVVNLTVGISSGETFFDSDIVTAFYWNYYEYAGGLDMLMADVATSMTVAFRSFLGAAPVPGHAVSQQSYVHVRWGFAVVPIVVVVATALFLALAIHRARQSGTEPWKSSALAMLFHGLDEDVRARFDEIGGLDEKKRQAKGVKVQLDESDENRTLLRS